MPSQLESGWVRGEQDREQGGKVRVGAGPSGWVVQDQVRRAAWQEKRACRASDGGSTKLHPTSQPGGQCHPLEHLPIRGSGTTGAWTASASRFSRTTRPTDTTRWASLIQRPQPPSAHILPTPLTLSSSTKVSESPVPASAVSLLPSHKCRSCDSGPTTFQLGSPEQVPSPLCASHFSPVKCLLGTQGCCDNPPKAISLGLACVKLPGTTACYYYFRIYLFIFICLHHPLPCQRCVLAAISTGLVTAVSLPVPWQPPSFPTQQPGSLY